MDKKEIFNDKFLEPQEIMIYLLKENFIQPQSIVNGELKLINTSRRNYNLKAIQNRGPSYFLKQGVTKNKILTVTREAENYELLHSFNGDGEFSRYLPRFHRYDSQKHLLIIEHLRKAQNLREYHTHISRFSTIIAEKLGNIFGSLHRLTKKINAKSNFCLFKHEPPSIFLLHRPTLRIFQDISEANIELIKVIQNFPDYCERLTSLQQEWRTDTFIHFDIKGDNCLIQSDSVKEEELKIIDWELAGLGDQCWDIGSVFVDYLFFWISTIPITSNTLSHKILEIAPHPLSEVQLAIRSFWESYVKNMGLDLISSRELLFRSVRYAAARLLQTIFEQMQMLKHITGNVIFSLQLSQNMIQKPNEAIKYLLGISLKEMM
ncbi:hypothetical protein BK726_17320 [Bacillus thuringiensis serovar londrina]|uniref:phosphotransferase n=1 Tax=Bacillus thuringiensis TaxID=1428 RepID=UPI000B44D852|nr:phosphotransferase [Bacillus thuringiensis]OTX87121.1 hypothetical protein BK726_17320 [Bacillus thuringiensis serovar londrina]